MVERQDASRPWPSGRFIAPRAYRENPAERNVPRVGLPARKVEETLEVGAVGRRVERVDRMRIERHLP